MALKFDINSGEFVEISSSDAEQAVSNTIHSGAGSPPSNTGIDGDFYIDTESMSFYGPKEVEWGACVCLLGKDGLPGADGKDGAPGRDGKDGLDGANGVPGRDGVSPPSIELQSTATHVQFRHGAEEWRNLFEIPKNKTIRGGGGGKSMANIQAAINAVVSGISNYNIVYALNSGLLGIAPSATTGRAMVSNGTGVAASFGALNIATAGNVTGTLQAAQFPALTGNVTTTAGSLTTTIANDAVTNARLANMATQTIKGRTTAGTGDPEDLTVSQVNTMLAGYDIPAYTMAQGA